jgi:cellulose synthase/poly-beta-1,6-N-acetylglucosamine synthase-like glycosyltransferase
MSSSFSLFLQEHTLWVQAISWAILSVGMIQNLVYLLQVPAAWKELRARKQADDSDYAWQMMMSDVAIPISVMIPAYNEETTIVESIRSMLSLSYPEVAIIVANDGSKDRTLQVLIEAFSMTPVVRAHEQAVHHAAARGLYGSALYPQLLVVDKENGGRADAINAAINYCRTPLFCVVDADSLLEVESLFGVVRPFMEDPKHMVAVGGTIRILNGCTVRQGQVVKAALSRQFLPLVQTLEYLRSFLMARTAWSHWGMLSIISGAFGVFRRDIWVDVGGFSDDTVGEDYEMVLKMHRYLRDQKRPYKLCYVPESVCWTQAPETWHILGSQRRRWQRGALEVFFRYRGMMFRPRYGKIGMMGIPYSFITDVLGPLTEAFGYLLIPLFWWYGMLNTPLMLAYIALFFMFGVSISIYTLILEELELRRAPSPRDLAILALISVVENFGYRQVNNLWRVIGWWEFLRKKKGWGHMVRTAISTPS